jgi:hypothetical protein
MVEHDFEQAAEAMLAQHGGNALKVAERRAERHELAKEREAAELWRQIARAVLAKLTRERAQPK